MQNVILAVNYLVGKDVWQVFIRPFYWFYWGFMWQGARTTIFLLVLIGFSRWFLLLVFMWQGAQTTISLAVQPGLEKESGGFFGDCRNWNFLLSK